MTLCVPTFSISPHQHDPVCPHTSNFTTHRHDPVCPHFSNFTTNQHDPLCLHIFIALDENDDDAAVCEYWSGRLALHTEIALKIIPMALSSIAITVNKSTTAQ